MGITALFPFTPLGRAFGFVAVPLLLIVIMLLIVIAYIVAAEKVKEIFFWRVKF